MEEHADGKIAILLAAERLFADRGFSVSLREISVAAGQRNHSAVQYHYGTRERLVVALFEYRMIPLNAQRLELIAQLRAAGRERDPVALVEAMARPIAGHVLRNGGGTAYARFIARLMLSGFQASPLGTYFTEGVGVVSDFLTAAYPDLSADRFHLLNLHTVTGLASIEQRMENPGYAAEHARRAVAELMTTLVAILTAPAA